MYWERFPYILCPLYRLGKPPTAGLEGSVAKFLLQNRKESSREILFWLSHPPTLNHPLYLMHIIFPVCWSALKFGLPPIGASGAKIWAQSEKSWLIPSFDIIPFPLIVVKEIVAVAPLYSLPASVVWRKATTDIWMADFSQTEKAVIPPAHSYFTKVLIACQLWHQEERLAINKLRFSLHLFVHTFLVSGAWGVWVFYGD